MTVVPGDRARVDDLPFGTSDTVRQTLRRASERRGDLETVDLTSKPKASLTPVADPRSATVTKLDRRRNRVHVRDGVGRVLTIDGRPVHPDGAA